MAQINNNTRDARRLSGGFQESVGGAPVPPEFEPLEERVEIKYRNVVTSK